MQNNKDEFSKEWKKRSKTLPMVWETASGYLVRCPKVVIRELCNVFYHKGYIDAIKKLDNIKKGEKK